MNTSFFGNSEDNQLRKINLIPCFEKYSKQSALFFIEKMKEKKIII